MGAEVGAAEALRLSCCTKIDPYRVVWSPSFAALAACVGKHVYQKVSIDRHSNIRLQALLQCLQPLTAGHSDFSTTPHNGAHHGAV